MSAKHADLFSTAIAVTLTSVTNPVWTYKLIFPLLKCYSNCELTADKILVFSVVLPNIWTATSAEITGPKIQLWDFQNVSHPHFQQGSLPRLNPASLCTKTLMIHSAQLTKSNLGMHWTSFSQIYLLLTCHFLAKHTCSYCINVVETDEAMGHFYCIGCSFSCLTDKHRLNAPPDTLPMLHHMPHLREV